MILKNNVRIPQNKKEFFKFIINEKQYYLDIQFNHKTLLNIQNLFLILKFYTAHEEMLIDALYINSAEVENYQNEVFNLNLFHTVDIKKLKKISYLDFKEWFLKLKENDHEYIKSLKYYGFRIVFNKKSLHWKEQNIYPPYPWNKNFKASYLNKNYKLELWLALKNRELYKKWILFMKKSSR